MNANLENIIERVKSLPLEQLSEVEAFVEKLVRRVRARCKNEKG